MNPENRALIVVIRSASWALADTADRFGDGAIPANKRGELADMLIEIADLLRGKHWATGPHD